ncbi:MAG: cob(I)yrinic acid a,c-diamide adenosyltransferase [Nanoarchaeota archaeon]
MKEIQNRKTYIYYDNKIDGFSNIAVGSLIKAIGENLNIAYIDSSDKVNKINNFIENLSLSYNFRKNLNSFHVDIFNLKDDKKILQSIIPQVEFSAITYDMFWNSLKNYDILIFDNFDFKKIPLIKIKSILINKMPKTQILLCTKDKNAYEKIKENFNIKIICNYSTNKGLLIKKGLINIYGNCKGTSTYAIGYLLKNFILKKDVKLIYFDKGDDIYGDAIFFTQLKKWNIENRMYGRFDFVKTGIKRYQFGNFRQENITLDNKEAQDGLMLLSTALKKQSPVIADELNDVISKGIINEQDVIDVIKGIKNELIITGKTTPSKIKEMSQKLIEFQKEL